MRDRAAPPWPSAEVFVLRRVRVLALVCLLASSLSTLSSLAWTPSPVPLWDLVERADLIVLAHVEGVVPVSGTPDPREAFPFPLHRATLAVQEVWKGARRGRLQLDFPAGDLTPAPPRYVVGETVLAFLAWDDDEGGWNTVGLSHGALTPRSGRVGDFRHLTAWAVELQRRGAQDGEARLAWLVEAASRPGTRWHGLFEIHPPEDGAERYYDYRPRPDRVASLSAAQIARIVRAFDEHPPEDASSPLARAVLGSEPGARARLAAHTGSTRPCWLVEAVASRGRPEPPHDPPCRIGRAGASASD